MSSSTSLYPYTAHSSNDLFALNISQSISRSLPPMYPSAQRKSDTLLTINTGVHVAPKLRNSASTASKPPTCDLQARKCARVSICAYLQGISADNSAYARPELLALTRAQPLNLASLTSFDTPGAKGKQLEKGTPSTGLSCVGPLDLSPNAPGKDSASAVPEEKVATAQDPPAASPPKFPKEKAKREGREGKGRGRGIVELKGGCPGAACCSPPHWGWDLVSTPTAHEPLCAQFRAGMVMVRGGEGKTSVAKAVAERVQIMYVPLALPTLPSLHHHIIEASFFPGHIAYTPYIELARHTETPIPTPKRLFKHSRGNAACRSSSVIAFDKVDQLLGVESRVILHTSFHGALRHMLLRHAQPAGHRGRRGGAGSRTTLYVLGEIVDPPNEDTRRNILMRVEERRLEKAPTESPLQFTLLAVGGELLRDGPIQLRHTRNAPGGDAVHDAQGRRCCARYRPFIRTYT
ncbi:hypothetical protein FIBSPDRAFT_955719 [Athelia psychrophila]|uniref:Uncharacterized protein n=1 Tax=Athelia psychrophila TaxID=1759441 RepID=A0A166HSJ5_9AGAM|nr:hypothetical protein FIBSPDRAFT_955719 [Fibularhizoctonia sp. CBS 109695]